jgi:hypothetical protein
MKKKGLSPIPVYHYGASEIYLQRYVNTNNYIALGATVPIKNKKHVASWVNSIQNCYPHIEFHLLGSSSTDITCWTDLTSSDSSTWIMAAINGEPRHIPGRTPEAKIERAVYNIERLKERSSVQQLRIC